MPKKKEVDVPEGFITTKRAAEILGVSPQTLRKWRHEGKPPVYYRWGKIMSRCFYKEADVRAYKLSKYHRVDPVGEAA